jgi:hypothetical protein
VSTHSFRRSLATGCVRRAVALNLVQQITGHKFPEFPGALSAGRRKRIPGRHRGVRGADPRLLGLVEIFGGWCERIEALLRLTPAVAATLPHDGLIGSDRPRGKG